MARPYGSESVSQSGRREQVDLSVKLTDKPNSSQRGGLWEGGLRGWRRMERDTMREREAKRSGTERRPRDKRGAREDECRNTAKQTTCLSGVVPYDMSSR